MCCYSGTHVYLVTALVTNKLGFVRLLLLASGFQSESRPGFSPHAEGDGLWNETKMEAECWYIQNWSNWRRG